jgi:hypothetical protein
MESQAEDDEEAQGGDEVVGTDSSSSNEAVRAMYRNLAKAHAVIAAQRRKMEEAEMSPCEEASSEEEETVCYFHTPHARVTRDNNSPLSRARARLLATPLR